MVREKERRGSRRKENKDNLKRLATTFFFTNFPKDWKEKELWRMFSNYGVAVDVYLARKLNKDRKRYGFVRYIRVQNVKELEKDLNKIWNGGYKLFVSVEKFKRKKVEEKRRQDKLQSILEQSQTIIGNKKQKSYAEVVKDVEAREGETLSLPWDSSSNIKDKDKSDRDKGEDDDRSIEDPEEEEDMLFVPDSFEDEESSTKSPVNSQRGSRENQKGDEGSINTYTNTKLLESVADVNPLPSHRYHSSGLINSSDGLKSRPFDNLNGDEQRPKSGQNSDLNRNLGQTYEEHPIKDKLDNQTSLKQVGDLKVVRISSLSSENNNMDLNTKKKGRKKRSSMETDLVREKDDEILVAEDSDILRCSNRFLRDSKSPVKSVSSTDFDTDLEVQKIIE
ncbi:hypothetical protein L6452_33850 [Arctium lappa]|uniref:Uncharacterized protein n=1 Tax=Arctium lappa TaxID=4217 RepID=A0ACB8YHQ9_ARCLA|nr:hypothetical protein L6452_33850 [Arctium lappa]